MAFRGRRRGSKPKVQWTGFNNMAVTLTGGIQTFVLWDPALYTQLAIGNVTLQAIVGSFRLQQIATTASNVNWYWGVFDTDATDTTPGALFPDPSLADVDTVEKKDLWGFGMTRLANTQISSQGQQDVGVNWNVKRRIGGNKAVHFVIKSSVADVIQMVGSQRLLAKVG